MTASGAGGRGVTPQADLAGLITQLGVGPWRRPRAARCDCRADHDVQGGRAGGRADRDRRAIRSSAVRAAAAHSVPRHDARRRIERADLGRRHPGPGACGPAGASPRDADRVRADAAVTINGLVRWTDRAGLRRTGGVGRHAGDRRWGSLRQRALGRPLHRQSSWSRSAGLVATASSPSRDGGDGLRLRPQPVAEHWRDRCVGNICVRPANPPRCGTKRGASLAYRKRTQPLGRRAPAASSRIPHPDCAMPDGIPRSAGALVDRAGLKGPPKGGARVSPTARQLHREHRRCDCR